MVTIMVIKRLYVLKVSSMEEGHSNTHKILLGV